MERGNRKKTARPHSSRQRATDIVTYSFLQEKEKRSETLKPADEFKVYHATACSLNSQSIKSGLRADLRPAWSEPLITVWYQSHKLILLTWRQDKNIERKVT